MVLYAIMGLGWCCVCGCEHEEDTIPGYHNGEIDEGDTCWGCARDPTEHLPPTKTGPRSDIQSYRCNAAPYQSTRLSLPTSAGPGPAERGVEEFNTPIMKRTSPASGGKKKKPCSEDHLEESLHVVGLLMRKRKQSLRVHAGQQASAKLHVHATVVLVVRYLQEVTPYPHSQRET